ncbi:MAG: glycosyltransferase [Ahrensia sp.]|nr:glycosyltransferase [Ahrensia sp.]
MKRLNDARILMYSHDTFGLGHLRRCRTIAHALVERFKGLTVLIISGSQIAGAFAFKARVDFVKIPSVIKLYSGDYTSISDHIDIADTLAMREALILQTATLFDPDIFIVDKEPLGLRGEVVKTLTAMREKGCRTILGLRDVMDAPERLDEDWSKRNVLSEVASLYDDVWIYGPDNFWDPLQGLNVPDGLARKVTYTGFLERDRLDSEKDFAARLPEDFILVTAGGGGDGADVMSMVLAAREYDRNLVYPLVLVTGPFMRREKREEIKRRAALLTNVTVIGFDNELETIIDRATAMIGMCGYNTFCEILSFDKPALFLPRTHPREEQLIRATRAAELGLTQILDSERAMNPATMADALHVLPHAAKPSQSDHAIDLDGLGVIVAHVDTILSGQSNTTRTSRAAPQSAAAVL